MHPDRKKDRKLPRYRPLHGYNVRTAVRRIRVGLQKIFTHCIAIAAIMAALELLWPIPRNQVGSVMWIEKLADGIVRVQTPIGPRYIMPSFLQRVYLLWMFRNFPILPHAVLNRRQQHLIDRLCSEQRFVSMAYADGMDEVPVIGTIERRPVMGTQEFTPRRPVAAIAEDSRLAAERQRS